MSKAREDTENQLVEYTRLGGQLSKDSDLSSVKLYADFGSGKPVYTRSRRALHTEIIEEYVSDGARVGRDGLAAFVTAGPPGAGKSTAVKKLGLADGYRVIDADKIKEILLNKAISDGDYGGILSACLPDGRPFLPNELATLVHTESADLATLVLKRSMDDGVNVVIEGTLNWPELRNRYLKWLLTRDYRRLTIVDVEVDCATAKKQASDRWWDGRNLAFSGDPEYAFGGRFTPPGAIDIQYPSGRASCCNKNAVDMFNDPRASLFDELTLYVYDGIFGEREPDVYTARDGVLDGDDSPTALNEGRYLGAGPLGSPTEQS